MKDAVDILNEEISRLRQRVKELEPFNSLLDENERLRQRVAELEEELIRLIFPVIESEWQELQRKYKERGERMKAMREWIENDPEDNGGVSFVEHYGAYKWFDPETGEPL